jgi:hypothetical protein
MCLPPKKSCLGQIAHFQTWCLYRIASHHFPKTLVLGEVVDPLFAQGFDIGRKGGEIELFDPLIFLLQRRVVGGLESGSFGTANRTTNTPHSPRLRLSLSMLECCKKHRLVHTHQSSLAMISHYAVK